MNGHDYFDGHIRPSINSIRKLEEASLLDLEEWDKIKDECENHINKLFGIASDEYDILFTSGSSESNSLISHMTTMSYSNKRGKKPHILLSQGEDVDHINACRCLRSNNVIKFNYIKVNGNGFIDVDQIKTLVTDTTCLISVSHVSTETGVVNDIKKMAELAHEHEVPFHTDLSWSFTQSPINAKLMGVDAFTISFDKIHGPFGVGALVIKKDLITGYNLVNVIPRSINHLIPSLAGATAAMKDYFKDRGKKNGKLLSLQRELLNQIDKVIQLQSYARYKKNMNHAPIEIILFGASPGSKFRLIRTILLSIVSIGIDNVSIKENLEKNGFKVSILSSQSEVISNTFQYAMEFPEIVMHGVIQIVLNDDHTQLETTRLGKGLLDIIRKNNTKEDWDESIRKSGK